MHTALSTLTLAAATLWLAACSDSTTPASPSLATATTPVKTAPVRSEVAKPVVAVPKTQKPVKPGAVTSIAIDQLFSMKAAGTAVVYDVRPPLFYRLGHIDGAESMPLIKYDKIIAEKRPQLDAAIKAGKLIILYCQNSNCPDAHSTAVRLSKLGYSTSIYRDGWEGWKQAGLE
ncbi:rhodanese-like domain-containing protein [Verrucomicrobiaceae bacterium 5K15]|uniref:Rhodanese-like domain-containing protein n=1 Tax=Oceaniferula flava TaxID=2800421 RepID=A0AAE2V9Z9_9BACT|nr:rhodanese-like domain-containing protein [Oceaniferula flavus]MBK1856018.1 rhodanese-like domain-containing protein [Oceaniferula flavus]MBM1137325.1 rhodanese-like domain-containing protein [Oceaniferula flavus]